MARTSKPKYINKQKWLSLTLGRRAKGNLRMDGVTLADCINDIKKLGYPLREIKADRLGVLGRHRHINEVWRLHGCCGVM